VLAIGLVVAIAGNAPPGASILWAPLAAIFGTIGLAAFFRGMAVGSISVVAPIAAVAAVVPVVFGIATGDDVSSVQLVGFVFALGGVALASFERPEGGSARLAAGVPWALAAVIGPGGYYADARGSGRIFWAVHFPGLGLRARVRSLPCSARRSPQHGKLAIE
jgi:drug/metabolite transporter (DMT)-like permease